MTSTEGQKLRQGGGLFRQYLPDLSQPRFTAMASQDAHEYAREFKESGRPPWLHALYCHWKKLHREPYLGVTSDGVVREGLYLPADEGVDVPAISAAADRALSLMDASQKARTRHHIDSPEWRTWSNPEFLLSDKGVRLDEVGGELREAVLGVLRAALSPEGYRKATTAMRINGFLGRLVGAQRVMNEHSYNFVLFGGRSDGDGDGDGQQEEGQPVFSDAEPWGFQLYGHHLCLNVFLHGRQMVVAPWFTGAEPNEIDDGSAGDGEHDDSRILHREEALGLRLMQSLPQTQRDRAQTYRQMRDPAMPRGRWNHDDQRHLCGAYRDNRVVPYEGLPVHEMDGAARGLVMDICAEYLLYLPARARELQLRRIEAWVDKGETYFSWIGGYGDDDAFYYRIQSPVVIAEFDHHSGVVLTNKEPAKFHVHTLLRLPNQGDYGTALKKLLPRTEQDFVWEG